MKQDSVLSPLDREYGRIAGERILAWENEERILGAIESIQDKEAKDRMLLLLSERDNES